MCWENNVKLNILKTTFKTRAEESNRTYKHICEAKLLKKIKVAKSQGEINGMLTSYQRKKSRQIDDGWLLKGSRNWPSGRQTS